MAVLRATSFCYLWMFSSLRCLLHVTLGEVIFMFHGVACFGIWEAALLHVRQLYSLFILGGGVDDYVRQFWLKE